MTIAQAGPGMLPDVPELCFTDERKGANWITIRQCWYWASKRPATRPPRPWSSAHDDGSGKILSNIVRSQIEEHAPFGGVVPEIAARAHVEAARRHHRARHGRRPASASRARRRRRRGGPGPDRRRHRRADHRKGDRAGARQAAGRGQPSRGACADRRGSPTEPNFPIACSSPRAAIPRSSRSAASANMCGSAPPSTTRSARPSTRPRSCWACLIRAGRRSRRRRRSGDANALRLSAADAGPRRCRISRSRD